MRRNYKQINQLERDQIAIQRSKRLSFSAIGKVLGRSGSALFREYKSRRRKKEAAEIGSKCEPYEENIYSRLCEGWTPEQIAGRLSIRPPDLAEISLIPV